MERIREQWSTLREEKNRRYERKIRAPKIKGKEKIDKSMNKMSMKKKKIAKIIK